MSVLIASQALEGTAILSSRAPDLSGQVKHKALSAHYPSLVTLRSSLRAFSSTGLERPDDPESYTSLLEGCLIASRTGGVWDPLPCREAAATSGSQQEAIDRILIEVSRRDAGNNVLLFGLKASFAHVDIPINTTRPAFENRHANSPSAVLRGLAWKILRSRIGDVAFKDLLVLHSLFLPIGNNCYTQLTGTPISDLPYLSAPSAPIIEQPDSPKRKRTQVESGRQARKRQRRARVASASVPVAPVPEPGVRPPRASTADRMIWRGKIFYGVPKRDKHGRITPGLPLHHVLNKSHPSSRLGLPPSDSACLHLLQQIFPSLFAETSPTAQKGGPVIRGSRARIPRMTGMIRELYARHAEVDYVALLQRCKARKVTREGGGLEVVTQRSVFRFVAAVVRGLFPPTIIGSEHNQGVLLRHMRHFIEMRQHEVLGLHTLMQDIRIEDIPWLLSTSDERVSPAETRKKQQLVEDLVYWIFSDLLIPLVKNTFYVTETAATRYETVYYLQEDWERETKPHLRKLESELLEELTTDQAQLAKYSAPLGVSAVRLVPKPNGFRPIINLGKRLNTKVLNSMLPAFAAYKSTTTNQVLRGVHQVLTLEKDRHRGEMGCTLFGTNEVFPPLQSLKRELLAKYNGAMLYFVKMDIKSAFDTIKQDKMLEIVENLLDQDNDYCLVLYRLLLPPPSQDGDGRARRWWKYRAVVNDGQSSAFSEHAKDYAKSLRNAVLVDMMRKKHITKEDCMALLRVHIQNNLWEVEGKMFRQKTGIPQGSKISSLLCSFFYAVLEKDHLGFVNEACTRLLRYIDDFLLITDDLALARRFVRRMQAGFPEFGAHISPSKTLLSFEFASGSQVAPVCVGSDGKSYFPYCGFLIDTVTLDMSMDYARTMDTHMKQSFAIRNHRRKFSSFVGWFSRQLENRNHVAYLDSKHNTLHTVRVNVFLNFALTTMKVPHYFGLRPGEMINQKRAKAIADSLVSSALYSFKAGQARVRFASRLDVGGAHGSIKQRDFMRIAQTAMIKVLSRNASQYKRIVNELSERFGGTPSKRAEEDDPLEAAVEEGWAAVRDVRY